MACVDGNSVVAMSPDRRDSVYDPLACGRAYLRAVGAHARWKTRKMFTLAGLKSGERVVDFGSGDGSTVIDAVRDFGATAQGVEIQWSLCAISRMRSRLLGLSNQTRFHRGDLFRMSMPDADVVFSYLFPEVNARLEPLLRSRYPAGTRVVSRTFSFPGLPLVASEQIGSETVFLYRIP